MTPTIAVEGSNNAVSLIARKPAEVTLRNTAREEDGEDFLPSIVNGLRLIKKSRASSFI